MMARHGDFALELREIVVSATAIRFGIGVVESRSRFVWRCGSV